MNPQQLPINTKSIEGLKDTISLAEEDFDAYAETLIAQETAAKDAQIDALNMRLAELELSFAGAMNLLHEAEAALAAPGAGEPVAWTVAGEVTNWARDFSKYRTQHYVRPVYTRPPAAEQEEALKDGGRPALVDAAQRFAFLMRSPASPVRARALVALAAAVDAITASKEQS